MERLSEKLQLIENQIHDTMKLAQSISMCLNDGSIPSHSLYRDFCVYQNLLYSMQKELNQDLKELNLEVWEDSTAFTEIKTKIDEYFKTISKFEEIKKELKDKIEQFNGIMSDTEKYQEAIEREKLKAAKINEQLDDETGSLKDEKSLIETMKPYEYFLKGIRNGAEDLDEEEDELITSVFEHITVKGLYRKKYYFGINPNKPNHYIETPVEDGLNTTVNEPQVEEKHLVEIDQNQQPLEGMKANEVNPDISNILDESMVTEQQMEIEKEEIEEEGLSDENLNETVLVTYPEKTKLGVTVFNNELKKFPFRVHRLSILTQLPLITENQFLQLVEMAVPEDLYTQLASETDGFVKDAKKGYLVSIQAADVQDIYYGLSSMGWQATQKETLKDVFDRRTPFIVKKIGKPDWSSYTTDSLKRYSQLLTSYVKLLQSFKKINPFKYMDSIENFECLGNHFLFDIVIDNDLGQGKAIMTFFNSADDYSLFNNMIDLAVKYSDDSVKLILAGEIEEVLSTLESQVPSNLSVGSFLLSSGELRVRKTNEISKTEEYNHPFSESEKENITTGVSNPVLTSPATIVDKEMDEPEYSLIAEQIAQEDLDVDDGIQGQAKYLLENDDRTDDTEMLLELTEMLISEDRLPLAAVWAKSVSRFNPILLEDYKRLLHATDMNLEDRIYDGNQIGLLFSEGISQEDNSTSNEYLYFLSALIRALLKPDSAHDFTLLSYAEQVSKSRQVFFDTHPNVKLIIAKLKGFLNYEPLGFTDRTFSYIRNVSQLEENITALQSEAHQMNNESLESNIAMAEVKKMLRACLGKESELFEILQIIEENKQDKLSYVKSFFDSFAVISNGEVSIDNEMLNGYIDDKWHTIVPKYFKKSDGLFSVARKNLEKKIRNRLILIGTWLCTVVNDENKLFMNEEKQTRIRMYRDELLILIDKALKDIILEKDKPYISGLNVLHYCLHEIQRKIENLGQESKWVFSEFLKSIHVELDQNAIPVVDFQFNGTKGYESWRRVLLHIVSKPMTLEERFESIIGDPNPINRDDFGIAKLIQNYFRETESVSEYIDVDLGAACQNAETALTQHIDGFKSNFEMAYMHGSIDEIEKETMIQLSEDYKSVLLVNNNFGFYMRFLDALTKNIAFMAEKRTIDLRRQYQEESIGKSYEEYPIRNTIEKLLYEGNVGLAAEYVDNLRQGIASVDDEYNVVKYQDYHLEFLNEYDSIYERCLSFKGRALRSHVDREMRIIKSQNPDYTARVLDSSESFMKSWPKQLNESSLSALLQRYFKELGFSVTSCVEDKQKTNTISQNWQTFRLYINPEEKNLDYYNHPISKYGTQANEFLRVICMFGGINANEMIQTISKLDGGIGSNTIILLDNALTKPERRKIAEKYKSNTSWQNSFLLIDQVLTLFLAGKRQQDRMEVLLKCTLPYTYYQPYNNDGGFIADEMFFGRKKELAQILDPNGSCLVYGGRQLGKTALLLRAKSIANKPANKEFTVFVNAQGMTSSDLVLMVSKEMKKLGLLEENTRTWEELCDELQRTYTENKYVKLMLLIDEVDDFLDSIKREGYLPLKELRELRRETSNNFKFVLAGLHNVTRLATAKENNSIIPQLGEPLPIKPFSPSDAAMLLKIPLSYLGYSFENESLISMILLKTNYYPGLLHFFSYTLVQTVSEKYKKYYSAEHNPPYVLDNEKLKAILFEKEMNTKIKDKFFLTLLLDPRYLKIAYVLAYLFLDPIEVMPSVGRGYTVEAIKEVSDGFAVAKLEGLPLDEYNNLLLEMSELGVLSHFEESGKILFKFRKYDFSKMFGTDSEIFKHLEEVD